MSGARSRLTRASTQLIVAALLAGLVAGILSTRYPAKAQLVGAASVIGGAWLDALRMTIIPLLFSLLVKGVVSGTAAVRGSNLAARSIAWFLGMSFLSALVGAIVTPALLVAFPLPAHAVLAMRGALATVDPALLRQSVASTGDFVRSFVPANPFRAAADGAVLQVMVFGLLFGIALGFVEARLRQPLVALFDGVGQVMLVIIGWILVLAPIGVFALAFTVGAGAGTGAFGAVAHYLIIYCLAGFSMLLAAYLVAVFVAKVPLLAFGRALLPVQSFALSTQSSTASLPLMLQAARELGVRETTRDVTLPMAAALFRVLGPAMNIAVCFYIAHWLGIQIGVSAWLTGVAVATFASISAPGLPGQISFVSSVGPIALAMGLPLAPLGIFIALEPIPDMFRTLTNVTMDVAVAGAVDRQTPDKPSA